MLDMWLGNSIQFGSYFFTFAQKIARFKKKTYLCSFKSLDGG